MKWKFYPPKPSPQEGREPKIENSTERGKRTAAYRFGLNITIASGGKVASIEQGRPWHSTGRA